MIQHNNEHGESEHDENASSLVCRAVYRHRPLCSDRHYPLPHLLLLSELTTASVYAHEAIESNSLSLNGARLDLVIMHHCSPATFNSLQRPTPSKRPVWIPPSIANIKLSMAQCVSSLTQVAVTLRRQSFHSFISSVSVVLDRVSSSYVVL